MQRFHKVILIAVVLVVGGWLLLNRNKIQSVSDAFRLASAQISALGSGSESPQPWTPATAPVSDGRVLVATFNLHNYGRMKSKRQHVLDYYSKIIKQFDVVALQEIRTEDTNVVTKLLDQLNQTEKDWAIVVSPHVGRGPRKEQFAFVYNVRRLQLLGKPYLVADPDDLVSREPFVGWFRALGTSPDRAFTFSLVNFHLDQSNASTERKTIPTIIKEIRNDGRFEDDVILAGDLNSGDKDLRPVLTVDNLNWLLREQKTDTQNTRQSDNFVVNTRATVEFTGRCGVFDFMREFNMTLPQALEVSDHLPVWAEFSVEEGMASGAVATGGQPAFR